MRRLFSFLSHAAIGSALVLCAAAPASAEVYGFSCITQNIPGDCAILEAQIGLEVTAGVLNSVNFRFTNTGPSDSTISEIYFNDLLPPLLSAPAIISSPTRCEIREQLLTTKRPRRKLLWLHNVLLRRVQKPGGA
jgi:hypothetical protein